MDQPLPSTGTRTFSSVALAGLGVQAIESFKKVENIFESTALDREWPTASFLAEADRFELWAANLGLFVTGHGSLDYRVREAEHLAQTLARFLQELINSLDDVIQISSGTSQEPPPGDDENEAGADICTDTTSEDEDDESDIDLLLDGVRDPIRRLFKISTKIRNPSTRIGSSKAAVYRKVDEDTGVDFLQVIAKEDYDYVRSVFLEHQKHRACQEHERRPPPEVTDGEKTAQGGYQDEVWEPIRTVLLSQKPGSDSFLITRIAQANTLRRRQFAYWAQHRHKLHRHTQATLSTLEPLKGNLPPVTLPGEDDRPSMRAMPQKGAAIPSVTTATNLNLARLEITDDRSTWTVSEYAPSTWQPSRDVVDFPPPPNLAQATPLQDFFECPYCFTLCARQILAEKAWKAHLIHDLRPYVCTYEYCNSATQLYDSRQDWVQHENSAHRKVWRCLEHSSQVFTQLDQYKRHLGEEHAELSSLSSYERIIQASESVLDGADRPCPICSVMLDSARAMEGHIALHLERLARFSFPRSVVDDEDWSNVNSDRANGAVGDDSRDGDFTDSDVASEVVRKRQGDAVLIGIMGEGRDPSIAAYAGQQLLPSDDDIRDGDISDEDIIASTGSALTEGAMLAFNEAIEEKEKTTSKGAKVASGNSNVTVQVTAAETLACAAKVSDIALSPDDRYLASCEDAKNIRTRDAKNLDGGQLEPLKGHTSKCLAVAWAQVSFIATGDCDGAIKLWSGLYHKWKCIVTNQDHKAAIIGLTFSPDGQRLLSVSSDKTSRLWKVSEEEEICELVADSERFSRAVQFAKFIPNGERILTASGIIITVSDVSNAYQSVFSFLLAVDVISALALTVDGKQVIVGCAGSCGIDMWDISTGSRLRNLTKDMPWGYKKSYVTALAMSRSGSLMASATADGFIQLWDTESWTPVRRVLGHTDAVNTMLFSSDDQQLFSCSNDQTVRVWNLSVAKQDEVPAEAERRREREREWAEQAQVRAYRREQRERTRADENLMREAQERLEQERRVRRDERRLDPVDEFGDDF